MTEDSEHVSQRKQKQHKQRRQWLIAAAVILFLFMLVSMVFFILACTVFKPRQPRTQLLSATIIGVAPSLSFPPIGIQINITLSLQLLLDNPNHASFEHDQGKGFLQYQNNQVGETTVSPGLIPPMSSTILPCQLTVQIDELATNLFALIQDVLDGELVLETQTRIPGRVAILGIFKKHIVATSECQFTVGFPSLKVQKQECKAKTSV